jgi:phytoene synthase
VTTALTLGREYEACRALHRRHGTTYFWATHVLPARQRPHVHALYAYCREADEIVDDVDAAGEAAVVARRDALARFRERTFASLAGDPAASPVLAAFTRTVEHLGIARDAVARFLGSMEMDLDVASYSTWDDLLTYMDGSAAVIGEMMLPVLEPFDAEAALQPARDLGLAFQLTNFLRDVGEDLGRGRVYLPQDELASFGADPATHRVDAPWRRLMQFQIARARTLYQSADSGIELLPARSAACVRSARVLYSRILDEIEANDYDVFSKRARVPIVRKLVTAAWYLAGSIGTRKP